jgi:hypothetical protein
MFSSNGEAWSGQRLDTGVFLEVALSQTFFGHLLAELAATVLFIQFFSVVTRDIASFTSPAYHMPETTNRATTRGGNG